MKFSIAAVDVGFLVPRPRRVKGCGDENNDEQPYSHKLSIHELPILFGKGMRLYSKIKPCLDW